MRWYALNRHSIGTSSDEQEAFPFDRYTALNEAATPVQVIRR